MRIQLRNLCAGICAAMILMVFHEFTKAAVFYIQQKKIDKRMKKKDLFRITHAIDPIGLLLFITCYAGFSKPYGYLLQNKKTNILLGASGYLSMFLCALTGIIFYRAGYQNAFCSYFTWFSINLILVNLFPITVFDMGLILAGTSSAKYMSIIRGDTIIKFVLFISIIMGIIPGIGNMLCTVLLSVR